MTRIIPTIEDIQDAKGYPIARILTEKERDLNEIRRLNRICGCKKIWHEVMPTGKNVYRNDGSGYSDWTDWLDLPSEERVQEIRLTAEFLARKMGWIKAASKMKMPGGWVLSEAFEQVPGYSPGYFGNPITPMSSPHRMQNWGWAVWRRARQILKPYGWAPSRRALEAALVSHAFGQVGKVAVRVAAASLPVMFGGGLACDAERGHNEPSALCGLRESRKTLIKARGWGRMKKRWTHDENVLECINQTIKLHGYTVEKAERIVVETMFSAFSTRDEDGMIRSAATGGKLTERICFDFDNGYPSKGRPAAMTRPPRWSVTRIKVYHSQNPICTAYHTEHGPQEAVHAWRKQISEYNERISANQKLDKLLNRQDGAITVVFFEDSLVTGNCKEGTRRWADKHGYKKAASLIEIAKDNRYEARRVVDYVVRTY